MEQLKYSIVLEREEDGGFVVTVPALPGCVTQGDTREEALTNAREAIEAYLEELGSTGEPIPRDAGREYVEILVKTQ